MKGSFFIIAVISICSALLLCTLSTFAFLFQTYQSRESILLSILLTIFLLCCSISHIQAIKYCFLLKHQLEIINSRYRFFLINSCFNFLVSLMFLFGFIEQIAIYSVSELVERYFSFFSSDTFFYLNVVVYGFFGMPSFFLQLELRNRLLKNIAKRESDIIDSFKQRNRF